MPNKKSLRLITTLDCNLQCDYCCNKLPEVNSKFQIKRLSEINFNKYDNVCITGGEPLLHKNIKNIIDFIFDNTNNIYLYTNGLLLNKIDSHISYIKGINVGIHYKSQLREIMENYPSIITELGYLNNRLILYVEDQYRNEYLPNISHHYIKEWKRNDCFNNIKNEDWILLKS